MKELLTSLNERQLEAVTTTEGPVLILAGAGSGKTRVITVRTAYLIAEKKVAPHNILAVTFTNKAAEEMRGRIFKLLQGIRPSSAPFISTFHSLCARILRKEIHHLSEGYTNEFTIYDTDDSLRVIKNVLKSSNIDEKRLSPRLVQTIISGSKNRGISLEEHLEDYVRDHNQKELILTVARAYQKILKNANALDFDDLLLKTVQLFKKNDSVCKRYSEIFKYIMVDEYQDTNPLQFALVRFLTKLHQNICVVGDDNQSIYAFRYADIRNILDFEKHYTSAKVIKLEQNYRSTQTILKIAEEVIKHNRERKEKYLWTMNPKGEKAFYFNARDEKDEARFVVTRIREILQENPDEKVAILYRTNAQSRLFEEALRREGIRYRIVGALSFYQRAEIKDIVAYLKVILNPLDSVSLERIINTPPRGIGDRTISEIMRVSNETGVSLWEAILMIINKQDETRVEISNRSLKSLKNFKRLIEGLQRKVALLQMSENPVSETVITVIKETGYEHSLLNSYDPQDEARLENLQELINAATSYDSKQDGLREFIDQSSLTSSADEFNESEKVTLMTVHAAKGLEFPIVFLVGMEEGLFPHLRSISNEKLVEEERRLCYVAITRAQKTLYITHAKQRRSYREIYANEPSIFLKEMPIELLEDVSEVPSWLSSLRLIQSPQTKKVKTYDSVDAVIDFFKQKSLASRQNEAKVILDSAEPINSKLADEDFFPGDYVLHKKYGRGLVLRREGKNENLKLTINFPGYGQKKIIAKCADLRKI